MWGVCVGGRTVGAEGCARDLGELLARLDVPDHRLIEPRQVLVPVLQQRDAESERKGQRRVR